MKTRLSQADRYYNLGVMLKAQNKLDEAIAMYEKAIALDPFNVNASINLGNIFKKQHRFSEAIRVYQEAVFLEPENPKVYYNLGTIFQEQKRSADATESYQRALILGFEHASVYYNLGVIFKEQNRFDEAIVMFEKAIALDSKFIHAYINLGNSFKEQNRLDEAIVMYEKALALDPNNTHASLNRSLILLLRGKLLDGFFFYEKRLERMPKRALSQALWCGDKGLLAGKTLLLYSEQGLGDTIQFCRYIKMLSPYVQHIVFAVEESLVGLMHSSLKGVECVIEKGKPLPAFDYHCSLLSLPYLFKTTLETIPSSHSYLYANVEKVSYWHALLDKTKPKVGLVWSGSQTYKGDALRSISLKKLLRYLPKERFEYVCLQKEIRQSDQKAFESTSIRFFGKELGDFSDTAALCSLMDLVVSVDTSVAHLSAALGKKTLILLPFAPDWRWMLDRNDTPWYPSVKLLRQNAIDDWESVLVKINRILINFES
ncbi:MAG: tetratricopeptide repeat-containing glycosyltransferase family protein [Sulfurospirillum cavolei]|nr:tetratricopeptide repeat-containing glycosyltransferase family protein [Sulfurospirillum cavolei]